MKKKITWLLCLALAFSASACGKNSEAYLKPGIYTLENAVQEIPEDNFTITVNEDGTFQYYETLISSYIGMGHYSVEKGVAVFKEDVPGCSGDINYYRASDDRLLFISEGSANYRYVPLEDGASFAWTSEVSE